MSCECSLDVAAFLVTDSSGVCRSATIESLSHCLPCGAGGCSCGGLLDVLVSHDTLGEFSLCLGKTGAGASVNAVNL